MTNAKRQGGTGVIERQDEKLQPPRMWKVVLHNDDFTPMDFVVAVLVQVFHHEPARAAKIMRDVHEKGKGVAGTFTFEVAETKLAMTLALADKHEHPLQASLERE